MQLYLSDHNYYPLKSMWNIYVIIGVIGDESREVIGIAILGVIGSNNLSLVKINSPPYPLIISNNLLTFIFGVV